jgi:hypothetical protein
MILQYKIVIFNSSLFGRVRMSEILRYKQYIFYEEQIVILSDK